MKKFFENSYLKLSTNSSVSALDANRNLILDANFDQDKGNIRVTKSILQYVHKLDILCLPKDRSYANADSTYQLTVEYGALGITKMIAGRFGLNCVQVRVACGDFVKLVILAEF